MERPATEPSRRRPSARCRTWPTSGAARSGSPAPTGCRARPASPRCCRCCASTVTTGASPCWSWRTCTSPTRRPWTWSATSPAACAASAPWWSRRTATTASPRTVPCARPWATPRRCAPPGGSPSRRSRPSAVTELSQASGHEPDAVHALTGGNPFFVSEVLRAEGDELPASARDAVLARAARLSPAGREVLDAAALVGERVEPALLARRHRRGPRQRSTSPSPPACSSPTVRCCGSATRSPAGRSSRRSARTPAAEMHRRILAELERVRSRRRPPGPPRRGRARRGRATVRYARRAGDRSAELASRREAVTQYRRALRFVGTDQPLVRADLLDALGRELATLDQWAPAAEALEESIGLWRAEGVPLREGDALRRLVRRLLPPVPRARGDGGHPVGPGGPRAARSVARARLGAVAHGRRVHGQRGARGVRRSTPAAPSSWPTPSACPTSPATRATRSRASSTTAATGGTPGCGRRSTWPWSTGCTSQAGRAYANLHGPAHRRHALPGGGAVLPRGPGLLRRARPGHQRPLPRRWPGRRAHAHRALGRGRGDRGGPAERGPLLPHQPGHVPGAPRARRGRDAASPGCGSRLDEAAASTDAAGRAVVRHDVPGRPGRGPLAGR